MTPKRIQRKRVKGWRMPDGVVYVGRPTRFANPYRLASYPAPFNEKAARDEAVGDFKRWLELTPSGQEVARLARAELRGKDLACWCPIDQPCHADVLLRIANAESHKIG